MALATIHGYPRIGKNRELKKALESYWAGKISKEDLLKTAKEIQVNNWQTQKSVGIDLIPSGDFSLYDHVLDTTALLGTIPPRFRHDTQSVDLDTYFAMARGRSGDKAANAMDMTKWFDTNYHYIVPELYPDQEFKLSSSKFYDDFQLAKDIGISTKPVLVGPATYLLLSRSEGGHFNPLLTLSDKITPIYIEVINQLANLGAEWIQLDEPVLVEDRTQEELDAIRRIYDRIASNTSIQIILSTYFGHLGDSYQQVVNLPVSAIGLDLVRGHQNLEYIRKLGFPQDKYLVAGVVDGRNVWTTDLHAKLEQLEFLATEVGSDKLMVSSSCSLLHVPIDVNLETHIDDELKSWLAFAEQKLEEIVLLRDGINLGRDAIKDKLQANAEVIQKRNASIRRFNPEVREKIRSIKESDYTRYPDYKSRIETQRNTLPLPLLPTTTIGSFPQIPELRQIRRKFENGDISQQEYEGYIENKIRELIELQEDLGLDVFVHGEYERNDMVQYFGEQLDGFAFTRHGWVQSYGSRYVRPPIIYGDVNRPAPMTVRWITFAQSLTEKPVKGMLTGPVTILNWSFVRDDQPRSETCLQIARAIREEVLDLESAGIKIIQIDEPAIREGLPLRKSEWKEYLDWAVKCFRYSSSGVRPETQIHTHMCYSEFGDIIEAISDMDADVLYIENARSDLEMLEVFRQHGYDKGVGPGVYDVHSPRVPTVEEMADNIRATLTVLRPEQVWVNPDCGLKTRRPEEATPSLRNMVQAANQVREEMLSRIS